MQTNDTEPMNTSLQFCPNVTCSARGQIGQGTITIHDRKRQRYRCRMCGHTFSGRRGTLFEGLRKPTDLIVMVVTLTSIWMSHSGHCACVWVRLTDSSQLAISCGDA